MQTEQTPMQTLHTIVSEMKDDELIECHAQFTASLQRPQSVEGRTFDRAMIVCIEREQARRQP